MIKCPLGHFTIQVSNIASGDVAALRFESHSTWPWEDFWATYSFCKSARIAAKRMVFGSLLQMIFGVMPSVFGRYDQQNQPSLRRPLMPTNFIVVPKLDSSWYGIVSLMIGIKFIGPPRTLNVIRKTFSWQLPFQNRNSEADIGR